MNNNFGKINKQALDAAKRGDKNALLSSLSPQEQQKLAETLNDKDKLKSLLNSDAARQLMKMLGGKQNG